MNPNYIHTITVFHKTGQNKDSWARQVFHDCFFKATTGTVASGNTLNSSNVYVARIPAQHQPLSISEGDIIALGEIREDITGVIPNTAVDILRKYQPNAFRVTSFSDNTSFPVDKHYRAGG